MRKNEILSDLFQSEEFDKMLLKVMRKDSIYFDDFKQDLFLILCSQNDEEIEEMHENCTLDFFVFRIILNQVRSETSPFYRTYKKNLDKRHKYDLKENDLVTELALDDSFNVLAYCRERRLLTWYEEEILSQYYGLGRFKDRSKISFRDLANDLGIHYVSLRNTVADAVDKIREDLKTNYEK